MVKRWVILVVFGLAVKSFSQISAGVDFNSDFNSRTTVDGDNENRVSSYLFDSQLVPDLGFFFTF